MKHIPSHCVTQVQNCSKQVYWSHCWTYFNVLCLFQYISLDAITIVLLLTLMRHNTVFIWYRISSYLLISLASCYTKQNCWSKTGLQRSQQRVLTGIESLIFKLNYNLDKYHSWKYCQKMVASDSWIEIEKTSTKKKSYQSVVSIESNKYVLSSFTCIFMWYL